MKQRIATPAILAASLAAMLAGSGCESALTARALDAYPPPGRMVEVEPGRRIQIDCRGEGSPTIVFQSGGDVLGSLAWSPVLPDAARTSRACAYSRAGIMWSDPDPRPFEPKDVAEDLHAALAAAGEKAPYVLVGHSRGGLYNLIFAGLYRDEVAGMVFVDSSHPDQEQAFADSGLKTGDYVPPGQELALMLRWTGLLRLEPYPVDPSIGKPVRALYPRSAAGDAREARHRGDTLELAGLYRDLRNLPVIVLAREPPEMTAAWREEDARNGYLLSADGLADDDAPPVREGVWRKLQKDISTWSSRGRLETVPNSNHAFFFNKPEAVLAAVAEVVAAARVTTRPTRPAN
ncbi:MAG: alpha/beta hydrolase [Hyphomonadaceae bacterium]